MKLLAVGLLKISLITPQAQYDDPCLHYANAAKIIDEMRIAGAPELYVDGALTAGMPADDTKLTIKLVNAIYINKERPLAAYARSLNDCHKAQEDVPPSNVLDLPSQTK